MAAWSGSRFTTLSKQPEPASEGPAGAWCAWREGAFPVNPFPEAVGHFLDANVETVEQLEILRLLGENPHKEWGIADLGREVQATPQAMAAHLTALEGRGLLLTLTRGTECFCRYGPRTPELEGRLAQLLQVYRERPVTTINRVYARAKSALQSFADAFRIRKES